MGMKEYKQRGFTIIEVVLVLAIAGLIFLMVFIALPTLQANQRDGQRRDDLARFKAQITQFSTNNKGSVPATGCTTGASPVQVIDFVTNYMKTFNDPTSGNAYGCATTTPAVGQYYYVVGQKCNGEAMTSNPGSRNYAVQMKLEGSGTLCMDNL